MAMLDIEGCPAYTIDVRAKNAMEVGRYDGRMQWKWKCTMEVEACDGRVQWK